MDKYDFLISVMVETAYFSKVMDDIRDLVANGELFVCCNSSELEPDYIDLNFQPWGFCKATTEDAVDSICAKYFNASTNE